MKRLPRFVEISAGLLDPKHVAAIGPALWEFVLLIHWQTSPDGTVKGGAPIRAREIAEQLGLPLRTVESHLPLLKPYLETRRTAYGVVYRILRPSKFWRTAESCGSLPEREPQKTADLRERTAESCGLDPQKTAGRTAENCGYKEDGKTVSRRSAQKPREFECKHSPKKCSNRAWHVCRIITEASGLEVERFSKKDLHQAKSLADLSDSEIAATVRYLLEKDPAFWGNTPISPSTVLKYLPIARKNANGASYDGPGVANAPQAKWADIERSNRAMAAAARPEGK